jgi:hypothetical protein
MIRPKLHLPRRINNHITSSPLFLLHQLSQLFLQPIEIRLEILHSIEHRSIRSEGMFLHDFFEGDEVRDVDRAWVWRIGDGGVEVYNVDWTVECCEELVHSVAVG